MAAALLSSACAPARAHFVMPARPALLAAVTWNMNAGRGDLSRLLADVEAGRLGGAPPAHVVIFLQEMVGEDLPDVERVAGMRGWSVFFVPVHHDGRRTRGNAILSSRPILHTREIPLPRERQFRSAAAGAIDVAGQRLFVVSAHLENRAAWWKAALFSDAARGRQAEALVRALPTGEHGILGGDLNVWLGTNEPAWRTLARRFTDTPGPARTPTYRERLILDHLLFDLPAGWRAVVEVAPETYGSDHRPVVAYVSAS